MTLSGRPWWLDILARLAAPVVLFSIGLVSRTSELKVIVQPSAQLSHPFPAFLVMVCLMVFVAPLAIFSALVAAQLPPYFGLGVAVLICTPGGLASNVFAVALNASVEMNAMLTLSGTLAGMLLLPGALAFAVPFLLSLPAADILSPWPVLLRNFASIFLGLPIGFFIGNRFPMLRRPLQMILGPVAAIFVGTVATVQLPNVFRILSIAPLRGLLLLMLLPVSQFAFAYTLGYLMGQPRPFRMSMGLELGLRDVPIAGAIIITCFDGLPDTIITPAVAVCYVQGMIIILPSAVTALVHACRTAMARLARQRATTIHTQAGDHKQSERSHECYCPPSLSYPSASFLARAKKGMELQ